MLCQFTFSNFKSYKDEVTLDLTPANISEHPETLIVDDADNSTYLPVAAIYGPNGGGKSNVIEAFSYFRKLVLNQPQINYMESSPEVISVATSAAQKKCFMFDSACAKLPSSFEVIFRAEGCEYKYILAVKNGLVVEENLYATDTVDDIAYLVFERVASGVEFGEILDGAQADRINPAMPLIQYLAATYDYSIINNAMSWFRTAFIANYGNSTSERTLRIPEGANERLRFFNTLHEMDIPIENVQVDKNDDGVVTKVITEYLLDNGKNYFLDFTQESAGTRKLLSFLSIPLNVLQNGRVLFVDELDAKLHPKMIEYIIKLFTDSATNKHGAQLIFTSHDLYTMNNTVFRRDEIWFAAKGDDLSSRLYSLSEFKKGGKKPRKDENYGKQYIEGRYGADPYLKKIVDWEV